MQKTLLLLSVFLFCGKSFSQKIASGYYHSLNICADSTSQAWGNNSRGQLGDSTTTYRSSPVSVLNLSDVISIDGGFYYSMALKANGTVWTWGDNYYGMLGNGTNTNSGIAAQVTGVSDIIHIAPGAYHAMVLKSDSTVWTWGLNNAGQLGTGNTTTSPVPVQVPSIDSVIAIAAGDDHCLAIKSDSTVWAWGMNDQGELGIGTTVPSTVSSPVKVLNLTQVIAVAGGGYKFSYALKADGTVWAWGYNQWGQLGNGTNTQSSVPVQVSNLTGIVSIAAHGGQGHALALRNDSTVWAWGYNLSGQLGDSTNTDRNIPVKVYGLTDIVAISCGHQFSLALKSDGTVWGWGDNQHGQLGTGILAGTYKIPVQVTGVCSMFPQCLTTYGTDIVTACNSYTWLDNITYTTSNNTASHTLVNAGGCDSIVTLNLTINKVSDTATSVTGNTITAVNSAATYQWLTCNNGFTPIAGETTQTFTPSINGNYAVELTENGCVDTSACVSITSVGIGENISDNQLALFPNPTNGSLTIIPGKEQNNLQLIVRNMVGQVVFHKQYDFASRIELLLQGSDGVYFFELSNNDGVVKNGKILKQ